MNVVLTAEAVSDLERIGDVIARDNPRRAASFVAELLDRCRQLAEMPLGFPLVPRHEQSGVRRRVYGSYLIFYRLKDDTVEVLHILHGARDTDRMLFPED